MPNPSPSLSLLQVLSNFCKFFILPTNRTFISRVLREEKNSKSLKKYKRIGDESMNELLMGGNFCTFKPAINRRAGTKSAGLLK